MKTIITVLFLLLSSILLGQTVFGINGIGYQITSANTVKVCCNTNFVGQATIPEQVEYNTDIYTVTAINNGAFSGSGLTGISIPVTVKSIGDGAFANCKNLSSLYIPSTVNTIGIGMFENCTSLKTARIPTNILPDRTFFGCSNLTEVTSPMDVQITEIGQEVFYGCVKLTSFPISHSAITKIGSSAFEGCTGLSSVSLPASLTEMGERVFRDCTNLTSIDMPNTLSAIGDGLFIGCSSLKSVTWPGSAPSIPADTFFSCLKLESFVIPNSVNIIRANAFYNCTNLNSVTIPDSVIKIEENAFFYCTNLRTVVSLNPNPANIQMGNNVFYGVPTNKNNLADLSKLFVPNQSVSLYSNANQWKNFANILPVSALSTLDKDVKQNKTVLSPNPAKTFVTISGDKNLTEVLDYSVIDLSGRILKSGQSRYAEKIDIESLKNGHYIIQFTSKTGKKNHLKLIKN